MWLLNYDPVQNEMSDICIQNNSGPVGDFQRERHRAIIISIGITQCRRFTNWSQIGWSCRSYIYTLSVKSLVLVTMNVNIDLSGLLETSYHVPSTFFTVMNPMNVNSYARFYLTHSGIYQRSTGYIWLRWLFLWQFSSSKDSAKYLSLWKHYGT